MKGKRESKKKPYRPAWSNALWSFREMLKGVPLSFWLTVAGVPLGVFLAWAEIRLPALVVSEVTAGHTFAHAAGAVGLLLGLTVAAVSLQKLLSTISSTYLSGYRYRKTLELSRKSMSCFYQTYERKTVRDLHARAERAIQMWNGKLPITDMPRQSIALSENVICYMLFGAVISFVSPWLVLLLTVAPVVNWLCARAYRQYEYATREKRTDVERRLEYVTEKAGNFAAAKDIRIYGMAEWLKEIYQKLFNENITWSKRLNIRQFLSSLADLLVILLRDGAAYALLISMALKGELAVDQFVLYFAAISNFATYIGKIMATWNEMIEASLRVCDYREYLDLPDSDGAGDGTVEELLRHAPEITFDRVSFRYEGAEKDTLHDLSFTIKAGERLALVGMNGAGKTTLVKLLCGLYRPTSGEIRVDGVPVTDFRREEYYRLISPVFQDVQTAFFSLAEIVSGRPGEEPDFSRAEDCMRKAGLGKKIDSLPRGVHTRLDKQVNKDGVELSGGEAQKLMMARAFYKDAPVLVLDEPTAALDPIAENEIYLQYRDMTQGKTSLFISHRLASTQFCDRIFFLQDGGIAEEGAHSQLVAQGGEYAKLYEIQSCWYREDYAGETNKGGGNYETAGAF